MFKASSAGKTCSKK